AHELLALTEAYLSKQLNEVQRMAAYPVVVVGIIQAANSAYVDPEHETNAEFRKNITSAIGRMLAQYAKCLEGKFVEFDQWLTSQFRSALDEFLKKSFGDDWRAQTEAILRELLDVEKFSNACVKFFGQLTHRVLNLIPIEEQIEALRWVMGGKRK